MAPLPESPSITHMAEISDLIITGTVFNITETANHTYIQFNNIEYIKNPQNTTTFTLKLYSGSPEYRRPLEATFEQDTEYLVFLTQDVRYHGAYGEYGRIPLTEVDPEAVDSLRFVYDPSNKIRFQLLMIYPNKINQGENVSITFIINNNQDVDAVVGFIIEHHPLANLIIDEADTSLKYFQYAKSVSMSENQWVYYKFDLSSNYTGVNTVVVTQEGSQVLVETFMVNELRTPMFNGGGSGEAVAFDSCPNYSFLHYAVFAVCISLVVLYVARVVLKKSKVT